MINMNSLSGTINKKNVAFWALYDFANSIVVVVFFLYFTQWLVVENNFSDFWYNMLFIGASILLVFTGPIFGSLADKRKAKLPFLRVVTAMLFIASVATALLANLGPANKTIIILAAICYMLTEYFYQFSLTFYDSLLYEIAPAQKRATISGFGQAANWSGQIAGILISIPILAGSVYLFGHPGRTQTLLPAIMIFAILIIPLLFFFKEKEIPQTVPLEPLLEYKNYFKSFFSLLQYPGVGLFLLSFFFYNDMILTAQNNFPIYLEQVFHVNDNAKSMLLGGILITSAIGAFAGGLIADRIGSKKVLIWILWAWLFVFGGLFYTSNFSFFVTVSIIMGFFYGATWTVSRAVMSLLIPPEKQTYAFSYYSLMARFATLLGPLIWGIITTSLIHLGSVRYKIAGGSLIIFIVIGILIAKKIPDNKIYGTAGE